jgi:CRISPR/Cas system-associated exonuclease Cas4 (RecB family)
MIPNIQTGIAAVLSPKKKAFPQHVNRISALDDPCNRRLYYMRAAWDKATEIDDKLAGVFESGNILEPIIERIASEVGQLSNPPFRIVGTQTPTNDGLLKNYQISGTIDGFLQIKDGESWKTAGVVDIKTMSPNIYPRINDYESLGRYSWTKKYRGQLQLYALAHNLENCYILFVNKSNLYEMKLIEFPIDMAYCESLLKKAEIVNDAVAKEMPPPGVNHPKECTSCRWYSFCCPDLITGTETVTSDNEELEAILDRMGELEKSADEYSDLEKQRDYILIKGQNLSVGPWFITWKQTSGAKPQWRKTITRMVA